MAARMHNFGKLANVLVKHGLNYRLSALSQHPRFFRISHIYNDVIRISMPALSPTMQEGTIVKWHKQEGDVVSAGDVLCDIQTDKAVVSFDTEEEGILAKIIKPENSENVQLGSLIALMVEEGDDWQTVQVPDDATTTATATTAATTAAPTTQPAVGDYHSYGPAVRSILDQFRLDVSEVPASGPHGRLLKGDLLRYIKANNLQASAPPAVPTPEPAAPVPAAPAPTTPAPAPVAALRAAPPPPPPAPTVEYEDLPLSNMRSIIARRLTESKTTIPHAYAAMDCGLAAVSVLRRELLADGVKISMNDFIIKAAAVALQRVPEVNAVWAGEGGRLLEAVDISVAVATDSGLITPIVTDALGRGLQDIADTVKDLAGRARENKLRPEEFQGGSFTISNLGMFGITEFSAVINPPQAAILAVGGSRLVLDADGQPETRMTVTLSADARVVDDFLAGQFLEAFRNVLENPALMLSQARPVALDKLFAK